MLTSRTQALYNSRFQTIMHNVMNVWIPPREHALEESEVGAEEEEGYGDEEYGAGENPACQLGESADGTWSWIERNVALAMLRAPAWGLLDLDKVFTVDMLRSVEGCERCREGLIQWRWQTSLAVGQMVTFTELLRRVKGTRASVP